MTDARSDQAPAADLRARRASLALQVAVCALGVLSAVLIARLSVSVAVGAVGIAIAALTLVPLAVPASVRTRTALGVAVVLTAGAVLGGTDTAFLLVPVAVLAWVAALVPWRVARGFALAGSLPWRMLCAILIALPALLLVAGALSGTVGLELLGWTIVGITLLIAVCLAAGLRSAAIVAAVLGLVTALLTVIIPGLLVIGTWWAGALLLVIGLAALVAWGVRPGAAAGLGEGLATLEP
ncbi:hypothetical protein [Leucobacter komagatae]|uniref:Uncharacterized protein n=1 Tax=Leucobacter komagatae TaxID=55969 RepID=A0A0D0IS10_9MICO|nr:hypothetical protein [Leucobacter komagatae]KIP52283.1 hypothetical protein SD72_10600 [Leucobacter komagatae]